MKKQPAKPLSKTSAKIKPTDSMEQVFAIALREQGIVPTARDAKVAVALMDWLIEHPDQLARLADLGK